MLPRAHFNGYNQSRLSKNAINNVTTIDWTAMDSPTFHQRRKFGAIPVKSSKMLCPLTVADNQVYHFGDNQEYQFKLSCRIEFSGSRRVQGPVKNADECGERTSLVCVLRVQIMEIKVSVKMNVGMAITEAKTRRATSEVNGAPYTGFANWQCVAEDIDGQNLKDWSEPDLDEAVIPAHIVLSPAIPLDTELGVDVYDLVDDDLIPKDQAEWRAGSGIWPIETFFQMLKANFQKLNFVPIGTREVQDVWVARDGHAKETQVVIQNIYRKHGWPIMARFNENACCAEIKTLLEERAFRD
ncbi:hypothetical protein PSPO01_05407 [Paraphaeosphaeria sporulosa]